MIKYYKKEDSFCKYYTKVNISTKEATALYRNHDGTRLGFNKFICAPEIIDKDYLISTQEEFEAKLEFIKKLL